MFETCIFLLFKSVTAFQVALNRNFPFDFITAAYTAVKQSLFANIAQFIANPGHYISQVLLVDVVRTEKSSLPGLTNKVSYRNQNAMLKSSVGMARHTINPNSPRAES